VERAVHLPRGMILTPGEVVRVRDDRWRVLHITPHDTCMVVGMAGVGAANRGTTTRFILPFERAERIETPPIAPKRVRPVVFRAAARRALASATPAWSSLRAAAAARVTLLPYQLEPALAVTAGLACRVLLADEVGLGKTIQAGLIVSELLAREADARILIVTPSGLRHQWRQELRDRFGIAADVLDAAALARAAATLPSGVNPWMVPRVVLASIDFIKRADVIRALEPIVWDLVAFDEAHGLAGRSDRASAADLLARRGRRVVAITATPHSGDPRAYERLCALGQLEAADRMLIFRRSRADAGVTSRRVMRLLRVRCTPAEEAMHRALDGYARRVWREAPRESAAAARLAMMVLARRAASSAASLAHSIERRLSLLAASDQLPEFQLALPLGDERLREDEQPDAELGGAGLPDAALERRHLERVHALARAAMARESKLAAILRLLRRAGEPAIVFTEYRDTLERAAAVLSAGHVAADAFARLHGGLTAKEREREARRFTHGDARLLLATDAASEGLNLHYRCRLVINLEVPWTPLRLEQRIGRVDRLGQERPVHAVALVARHTADESVVTALLARTATAGREAPFGGANLRTEAEAEAIRLHTSRLLQPRSEPPDTTRPVTCRLRRGAYRSYLAVRLTFVDAGGWTLWDTVIGVAVNTATAAGTSHAAVPTVLIEQATSIITQQLRSELLRAIARLIAREEAMLYAMRTRSGRLAAPLVQPGLFDRRALRESDAQRRLATEVTSLAEERVVSLRRLLNARPAGHRLVFAAVV
jgi:superfamily II DNA or RNA helicase